MADELNNLNSAVSRVQSGINDAIALINSGSGSSGGSIPTGIDPASVQTAADSLNKAADDLAQAVATAKSTQSSKSTPTPAPAPVSIPAVDNSISAVERNVLEDNQTGIPVASVSDTTNAGPAARGGPGSA